MIDEQRRLLAAPWIQLIHSFSIGSLQYNTVVRVPWQRSQRFRSHSLRNGIFSNEFRGDNWGKRISYKLYDP